MREETRAAVEEATGKPSEVRGKGEPAGERQGRPTSGPEMSGDSLEAAPARRDRPRRVLPGRSLPISDYAAPALLLLAFLILWQAAVAVFHLPHYILPSPLRVFQTIGQAWDVLLLHTTRTIVEVLAGFAAALAAGLGLAVLITYSAVLKRALYPLVIASQTVPVIAIAPLLIVWFGYDMMPKVVMTALIAFFPVVVNTVDGLETTDADLLDLMRLLRANWWQTFRKVRFPGALPFIFSGMKIAAAVSVIGAVIGEWVGADRGLGFLMIRANAQLRTDLIFASIVILSAMGVVLFLAVSALERISMPWEKGKGD
ncbi:MAG: ABC transporter permease [Nitrospinota bacterium]